MKRRKISPMPRKDLEALPTKRLLARLKRLHQCEKSLSLSDRNQNEYISEGFIEFKESPEWIAEDTALKEILDKREHVEKK